MYMYMYIYKYIYEDGYVYMQVAENLTVLVLTAMDDIEIIQSNVSYEARVIIWGIGMEGG